MNEPAIKAMIAVVDDDESVGRSLARFLKASGFHSVVYQSAEAFLADQQHQHFDCLIVDIQLGGMSGTDLQERVISLGEHTPIILMTAREERQPDESALQVHGTALLRKSDPGDALLATLRRMIPTPVSESGGS